MDILKFFPSKYLRGVDLNGRTFPLTMDRVEVQQIRNNKTNKMEAKPVLFFKGAEKGLIISSPVARQVAALHGTETDNWPGKRIAIFSEEVEAFGKIHTVVRVKPLVPPAPQAQALPEEPEDHEIGLGLEDDADLEEGHDEEDV